MVRGPPRRACTKSDNGTSAAITVNGQPASVRSYVTGYAEGNCWIVNDTINVQCTSFYDVRFVGPYKVTTRGTATLNGRPTSFTAALTDGGAQDEYLFYAGGQVIGGRVTAGQLIVAPQSGGRPVAM